MALLVPVSAGCSSPPPVPSSPAPAAPCLDSEGRLAADVDADGRLDHVTGFDGAGAGLRIFFGGRSDPRTPRDLLGERGSEEDEVMAAVADFDGDGWLDLAIASTGPVRGDDPVPSPVTELRPGPFSDRGVGQRTVELDLRTTFGLRVVDYNGDEHPDLASFVYAGDGVYEVDGLLGGVGDGLSGRDPELLDHDAWEGGPEEELPPQAMGRFYSVCTS